eukprot:CAMPEP_0197848418 /NCGR_PEP_ID=MMETSP1438-20131217/8694_1 /TAXON_ID=1461541 /ORGANISM="Pterosperma sp., Strain CCMP1384" /LENGTH=115 /DNA_ID=CAMNT_0043460657 /DNA_START=808 /DNA_END=1155 /DNA_ORIENTATION=+
MDSLQSCLIHGALSLESPAEVEIALEVILMNSAVTICATLVSAIIPVGFKLTLGSRESSYVGVVSFLTRGPILKAAGYAVLIRLAALGLLFTLRTNFLQLSRTAVRLRIHPAVSA